MHMSINGSDPSQRPAPWMAPMHHQFPPPAAAMVMPHHMMPPPSPQQFPPLPHYLPYAGHQFQTPPLLQLLTPPQVGPNGNNNHGENKTIWVGDLHQWMDENYLHSCFASTGEVSSMKVIRNKQTGHSEGYGFVEFHSHAAAEKVLQSYPGIVMPNTDQPFRLNWASFSMGDKRSDNAPDLSIFVGDLAADVNDSVLHETFATRYPSVKSAKVVFDAHTSRSKGYGFVRFGDENERTQAMSEMNGVFCSSRAMRIGPATPKKAAPYQQQGASGGSAPSEGDTTNTTIFVGGLDPSVADDDLKQPFSVFGEIVSVKIPLGKGCGFVQFSQRKNAEEALEKLNGSVIGKQTVRLSWGRSPVNKQLRSGDLISQWSPGPYYGGGYGYAMPSLHNPSMYAAAYGSYPVYGGDQQQVS